MSADCILCQEKDFIFEDDKCFAVLGDTVKGHVILAPKEHFQILEQIPDFLIAHLFNVANKLSTAVFESFKAQGTNILVQNGVPAGQSIPHLSIHILPRYQDDGINFQWKPKQLTQEQFSTIELKIKQGSDNIGAFEKEEKKEPVKIEKKEPEKVKKIPKGENYLLKQLDRIP